MSYLDESDSRCQLLACCPISYDAVGSLAALAASAWYSILVANEERLYGFESHLPVEGFQEHPFFFLWNFGLLVWACITFAKIVAFPRSEVLRKFQGHLFHLPGVIGMTVMGIEFTWALVPQLDPWLALFWALPTMILLIVHSNSQRNQFEISRAKSYLPAMSQVIMICYSMGLCILGFGRKRPLTAIATMILLAAHEMQKDAVMESVVFTGVTLCLSLSNVLYAVALSSGAYNSFSDREFWDHLFDWDSIVDAFMP